MFVASHQAEQWLFLGPYFTFFTHRDYRTLSSHVKKILFHSIYFLGLLIYHLGYQTEQIPTGFVSVAISGGFGENVPNLTGLFMYFRITAMYLNFYLPVCSVSNHFNVTITTLMHASVSVELRGGMTWKVNPFTLRKYTFYVAESSDSTTIM